MTISSGGTAPEAVGPVVPPEATPVVEPGVLVPVVPAVAGGLAGVVLVAGDAAKGSQYREGVVDERSLQFSWDR
jgi:hypothetical protein